MLKYIKVNVIIMKINIKSLIDNINAGLNTNYTDCLTFLKGNLLHGKQGDYSYLIDDIFRTVSTYKECNENDIERFNYDTNS